MSLAKIEKFLRDTTTVDQGLPNLRVTPIILTDSKGRYLKSQISSQIEGSVVWWYGGGWNSDKGLSFLTENIKDAQCRHVRVHVYVWLGTCDLTIRTGTKGHICLNPIHGGENLVQNLEKISDLGRSRKFKVTFLELPVYSIREYNKYHKHSDPESFSEDDKELQLRIKAVNEHIVRINESNQVISTKIPRFNNDLSNKRKNKGKRSRKYYTFGLLKDGLHPNDRLSKCWLRKICIKIRFDCYQNP